jgi:elongation factor G
MAPVLSNISEPDQPNAELAIRMTVPEEFAGAVMGELQSKRGYTTEMDVQWGVVIIRGRMPASEFDGFRATIALATQQRGRVERQ